MSFAWRTDDECTPPCGSLEVALVTVQAPFAYQAIASQATLLERLGVTASEIGRRLGVTDKTVAKAIRWGRSRD